jgi:predicted protein tyrosine phosphatase
MGELAQVLITPAHRWLFVCSANLCRSPTAEYVARKAGLLADSCGISAEGAVCTPLTRSLLMWAQVIVCMEQEHVRRVKLDPMARKKHVYCWNIPDDYALYDLALIRICEGRLADTMKLQAREV